MNNRSCSLLDIDFSKFWKIFFADSHQIFQKVVLVVADLHLSGAHALPAQVGGSADARASLEPLDLTVDHAHTHYMYTLVIPAAVAMGWLGGQYFPLGRNIFQHHECSGTECLRK